MPLPLHLPACEGHWQVSMSAGVLRVKCVNHPLTLQGEEGAARGH